MQTRTIQNLASASSTRINSQANFYMRISDRLRIHLIGRTMNNKIVLILFVLIGLATNASAQRRTSTTPPAPQPVTAKPPTARLMVQGTYEETFQGTTNDGNADGHLVVKFEAARWLKMETNEAGNAEFSDWDDAPAPDVSGSVSYHGLLKGGGGGASSDVSHQA